ncbi:hypothetical protein BP422_21285 [Brevibacillus formosus]|uniref:Phage tail tape measure protein n=1 Tax=Brevibacillus formosus TaxID=54913 RepID=A0A220MLS8_9BACL|nr:hypothetical protein [Brevibacillus formosus]ASJ55862.1 hypothetical protein BP422_21285 [Brevibacillus formosus]
MSEKLTKFSNFFDGYSEVIGKHEEFQKGLFNSLTSLAETALGTTLSSVAQEAQATEREKTLFEVGGKDSKQILQIDETSRTILELNPNIKKDQAYALIAKADLVHATNGLKYAEKAGMLKYTTRFTEDEIMKMMSSIEFSTGHDSTVRQSNAVQHLSNKGGGAATGKFVESMAHFNLQNGKLLNTPEKMAATFVSMGKLLNDFKTYGALYENAMKMSDNGDLAAILEKHYKAQNKKDAKAKAAQDIATLQRSFASGEKETINIALGKLLMTFSSIQDKTLQQSAFDTLTGDAGDDLAKGLREVNNIATGVFVPEQGKESDYKVGNEAVNAHQLSAQNDAYFKPAQAQAMARNEAMEIATVYAEQMSGINTGISEAAEGVMSSFNSLDESIKGTAIFAGGLLLLGSALNIHTTSQLKKFKDLRTTIEKFPQEATGGKNCCCCCCQGNSRKRKSGSSSKNRRNKNTPRKRRTSEVIDQLADQLKDQLMKRFPLGKLKGGRKGKLMLGLGLGGLWLGKDKLMEQFNSLSLDKLKGEFMNKLGELHPSKLKDGLMKGLGLEELLLGKDKLVEQFKGLSFDQLKDGFMNKLGELHPSKLKDKFMEQFKRLSLDKFNFGLKKVPYLGTLTSLEEVLTSENKLDVAARFGAETVGGWAGGRVGMLAGAALGSLVTPGAGSFVGGLAGGVGGNIGGSMAGGALYDWVKSWWQDTSPPQPVSIQPLIPAVASMPNRSPVSSMPKQPVSITIPQISVPLHVQGVLQDIPTMLKMLSDPSVAQRIKDIIERSLLDALETRGGVTT